MSPHGLILLTSLVLATGGKLLFPAFTLRIAFAVVVGLQLALLLWFQSLPSVLGFILIMAISAAGAAIGLVLAALLIRGWRQIRRPA
jgi:hypothetical protein